jgi:hypothetical protein
MPGVDLGHRIIGRPFDTCFEDCSANENNWSVGGSRKRYPEPMDSAKKLITSQDLEAMSPQQRADSIDASIVRSWDDVPSAVRRRIEQRGAELQQRRLEV